MKTPFPFPSGVLRTSRSTPRCWINCNTQSMEVKAAQGGRPPITSTLLENGSYCERAHLLKVLLGKSRLSRLQQRLHLSAHAKAGHTLSRNAISYTLTSASCFWLALRTFLRSAVSSASAHQPARVAMTQTAGMHAARSCHAGSKLCA